MKIQEIKDTCTACGACISICPQGCISLKCDEEGFYYPEVEENSCVKCGICEKNCHILNFKQQEIEKTSYYGFSKDDILRKNSSSGGAFSAIAQTVLNDGGNVYGAYFDVENYTLSHKSTDEVGINFLRKSKYIESYMGDTINSIQSDIDKGRKVLFCGTPCQVAGVKHCINDRNNLLLTVDFICHGVPSSALFKEHLEHITKGEGLLNVDFRPKEKNGWSTKRIKVETQKRTITNSGSCDTFYYGFITQNAFLRKSCYDCKYRKIHCSDITIADFWGYRHINPELNDEKGLSLIVANNDYGKQVVENLKDFNINKMDNSFSDYAYSDRDYSQFKQVRKLFYENYFRYGFEKAAKKTYMKDYIFRNIKYYIKCLLGRG